MVTKPPLASPTSSLAKEDLPTMYDLPSEDPEEPGLPDDFHYYQPHLLRETFLPTAYPLERIYVATDLNLYFDLRHTSWHKRPDWFVVLDKPAPRTQQDLRLSYVIWQEEIAPYIVVELLSPGTEKEDLGETAREPGQPPTKWKVYEQILKIPYYVVFSRYTGELQVFHLEAEHYRRLVMPDNRIWFEKLGLGLGIWPGVIQGVSGQWLRWYDSNNWIATAEERELQARRRAEQEQQRAEQEQQRAERARQRAEQEQQRADQEQQRADQEQQRAEQMAAKLRALGIDPDEL